MTFCIVYMAELQKLVNDLKGLGHHVSEGELLKLCLDVGLNMDDEYGSILRRLRSDLHGTTLKQIQIKSTRTR